jgi:hypothetical protein
MVVDSGCAGEVIMKVDHLIYGTLPDTPGSQHVIYKSDGITPVLQNWLIAFYDQFGDCRNENFSKSLSVCWYREQPGEERAAITQVSHHGKDFSGRWGALLRHSAILTPEQYGSFGFSPAEITDHLASSGTAEQLINFGDLDFEPALSATDGTLLVSVGAGLSFDDYRLNLLALLKGQRLVLYAENNTDFSNCYLRNLVGLLPRRCRQVLNWSEFVFRTSDDLDLSLVYSSRHEAPADGRLAFVTVGENHVRELKLPDDYAEDYLVKLSAAIAQKDTTSLMSLLTADS